MKTLDMNKTVAELVNEYPEVKDIMKDLGFKEIVNPAALKLMGKVMTIPKGSVVKGIAMGKIVETFEEKGFTVVNAGIQGEGQEPADKEDSRVEKLKALIKRVGDGEDIEAVRADFVKDFASVSVHEIADAEQSLINEGMPAQEVMKLCDLHSALFHGRTEAEIYAEESAKMASGSQALPEGHPVENLRNENKALEEIINDTESSLIAGDEEALQKDLTALSRVRTLYGKKEELILPLLKNYGITGPEEVMWGVDNEIKKEASRLAKEYPEKKNELKGDILNLTARMREMIYKEEKILFPLALEKFTKEEWYRIYADLPEMGCVYINSYDSWPEADEWLQKRNEERADQMKDGIIDLGTGKLSIAQLKALFGNLPIDITFIDDHEINTFYANEGKVFSRPLSSLGRSVYDCHPAMVRPVVKKMISQFKDGSLHSYERWIPGRDVRILYLPVRDKSGKYIGTAEIIQDCTFARKHYLGK